MYAGAFGGQEIQALNAGIKWQIAFVMAAKMTVTAHLIGCIVVGMLPWIVTHPDLRSGKRHTAHYDCLDLQPNKASMHINVLLRMDRPYPANI